MIWVARSVTRAFAREVVARAAAQGARAVVKATSLTTADIYVRDQEADREIVRRIILSFWNDGGSHETRRQPATKTAESTVRTCGQDSAAPFAAL